MKEIKKVRKLALARVVGDEENIIKVFSVDQIEQAKSFAMKTASEYNSGIISVFSAFFLEGTMERADGRMVLYEVYPCRKNQSRSAESEPFEDDLAVDSPNIVSSY